jgi:hypothetical protein
MKSNCWEVKRCGREPGGAKSAELGVCPAATEVRLNTVHGGKRAGRACWVVAGTLCGGQVQGTFASKMDNCEKCEFYKSVMTEEFPGFVYSTILLDLVRKGRPKP